MASYVITPGVFHSVCPITYGHQACIPGHTFGPAVRSHYLVHYVLKGKGEFWKAGQVYQLQKGDLFVICPGEVTTYRADAEDPWEYSWLGFQMEQIPQALNSPVIRQAQVRHIFAFLRDHHRDANLSGKIFSLVHEFIWLLSGAERKSVPVTNEYALYARTYMENAYMQHVSMEEIAQCLHINRRHLTAVFRDAFGIPPQEFLMRLRMEKAREFLNAGHNVSQAAAMAGYSDLSNFSRHYKQRYGVSPGKDRKTP